MNIKIKLNTVPIKVHLAHKNDQ